MCLHVRKASDDLLKHCDVLHDHAVHADFVQKRELLPHCREFVFEHDGIHRYINLDSPQMRVTHRLRQRFLIKIARVRARAKSLHA